MARLQTGNIQLVLEGLKAGTQPDSAVVKSQFDNRVPPPTTSDVSNGYFLRADGDWQAAMGPRGASIVGATYDTDSEEFVFMTSDDSEFSTKVPLPVGKSWAMVKLYAAVSTDSEGLISPNTATFAYSFALNRSSNTTGSEAYGGVRWTTIRPSLSPSDNYLWSTFAVAVGDSEGQTVLLGGPGVWSTPVLENAYGEGGEQGPQGITRVFFFQYSGTEPDGLMFSGNASSIDTEDVGQWRQAEPFNGDSDSDLWITSANFNPATNFWSGLIAPNVASGSAGPPGPKGDSGSIVADTDMSIIIENRLDTEFVRVNRDIVVARDTDNIYIGNLARANGTRSVALGQGSIADGDYSQAIGGASITAGNNQSTGIGRAVHVRGSYSVGIGYGTEVDTDNQLVIGDANNLTQSITSIKTPGFVPEDATVNAITIDTDGNWSFGSTGGIVTPADLEDYTEFVPSINDAVAMFGVRNRDSDTEFREVDFMFQVDDSGRRVYEFGRKPNGDWREAHVFFPADVNSNLTQGGLIISEDHHLSYLLATDETVGINPSDTDTYTAHTIFDFDTRLIDNGVIDLRYVKDSFSDTDAAADVGSSSDSMAFGKAANVNGDNSIALGGDTQVDHNYSVGLGWGAKSDTDNQLVIGSDTDAHGIHRIKTPHFTAPADGEGYFLTVNDQGEWGREQAGGSHARSVYVEASDGDRSPLVYIKHDTDGTVRVHTVDSEYAGESTGLIAEVIHPESGLLTLTMYGGINQTVPFPTDGTDVYIVTDTYTALVSGVPDNYGNNPVDEETFAEYNNPTIIAGNANDHRGKIVSAHNLVSVHTGKLGFTMADTDWILDNAGTPLIRGEGTYITAHGDSESVDVNNGYGLLIAGDDDDREVRVDTGQIATHAYVQSAVRNATRGEIGDRTDEHTLYLVDTEHDQLRFHQDNGISGNHSFIVNTRGDTVYQGIASRDDDLQIVQTTDGGTETVLANASRNWEAVEYGVYEGNRWDEDDAFTYNARAFLYKGDAPTTIYNSQESTFANVSFFRNGHNSSSRYQVTARVQLGVVDDLSHVRSHDDFHLITQSDEFTIELTSGENQITESPVRLPNVSESSGTVIQPNQYVAVRWAIHIDHYDDTGVSLTDAPYLVWAGTSGTQTHHTGRADVRTLTYELYLDPADGTLKYGNNTRTPELIERVLDTDGQNPWLKVHSGNSAETPGESSMSLGGSSNASHVQSIALGYLAKTDTDNQLVIGADSDAVGIHNIRTPNIKATSGHGILSVDTDGNWSVTEGGHTRYIAVNSREFDDDTDRAAIATGDRAVAVGVWAVADSENAIAIGYRANQLAAQVGVQSIAIGLQSRGQGDHSIGIGDRARATGNQAIAIGRESLSGFINSIALGPHSTPDANYQMRIAGVNHIKVDSDFRADTDYHLVHKKYVDDLVGFRDTEGYGINIIVDTDNNIDMIEVDTEVIANRQYVLDHVHRVTHGYQKYFPDSEYVVRRASTSITGTNVVAFNNDGDMVWFRSNNPNVYDTDVGVGETLRVEYKDGSDPFFDPEIGYYDVILFTYNDLDEIYTMELQHIQGDDPVNDRPNASDADGQYRIYLADMSITDVPFDGAHSGYVVAPGSHQRNERNVLTGTGGFKDVVDAIISNAQYSVEFTYNDGGDITSTNFNDTDSQGLTAYYKEFEYNDGGDITGTKLYRGSDDSGTLIYTDTFTYNDSGDIVKKVRT